MGKLKINSRVLGVVSTNCYFLINTETSETIIVDPAHEALRISQDIERDSLKPVGILLTHGHFDHIMAADELRQRYNIKVYAHEAEDNMLKDPSLNMSKMVGSRFEIKADVLLRDAEIINLAGFEIKVLHTPGHTQGGVCYYIEDEAVLISGDTLFYGSIGRTDFPGGSMSELNRSVEEKLFVLPGNVKVYPGHDSMTSIGFEKEYNPFF